MNYQEYLKTELLVLIPVLYCIGIAMKKSKIPDKMIPTSIGIASIILCTIWVFATSDICNMKEAASAVFTALTQGVLVAGASVYANQIYVQSKKDE